jgi:hypothetical protein
MFKKVLLGLCIATSFSASASKILVDNVIVNFDANNRGKEDVFVRNLSEENSYVKVIVTEVINAGLDNQTKIEHKNPKEAGIFVSPNKLVLNPKGTKGENKAIRIANLNKSLEKDRIYRIQVVPVIGDFQKEDEGLGVKILMGYEILTLIQPNKPVLDYSYTIEGKKLIISNTGNSNFLLHRGVQCEDKERTKCSKLPTKRIYADMKYTLDLPYNTKEIEYYIQFGEKNELKTFK